MGRPTQGEANAMSTTSGPALCAGKRNKATLQALRATAEPQDWAPGGRRRPEHTRILPAPDVAGGARTEGLQGQETGVQGQRQTCFCGTSAGSAWKPLCVTQFRDPNSMRGEAEP